MTKLLPTIQSPLQLHEMGLAQLDQVAGEIRETLCNLLSHRAAHFASNLGVVELTLALHSTYDFLNDRLIWDTGQQIYPHKLITGRYDDFHTIRTKGGLMGYPNPHESDYDLFMTGHAGASVSTVMGLRSGDELLGESDRHSVAVIGDGAFPSGIVYEAMNNVGRLQDKLLVILNDNKMSICPRVGGLADYLDRLRMKRFYWGLKHEVVRVLDKVPLLGDPMERLLAQTKEAIKAGLLGGMLFEELGFRYIGPIDGHNIDHLLPVLRNVRETPTAGRHTFGGDIQKSRCGARATLRSRVRYRRVESQLIAPEHNRIGEDVDVVAIRSELHQAAYDLFGEHPTRIIIRRRAVVVALA